MMKAEEFRIGNLLQSNKGTLLEVIELSNENISTKVLDRSLYPLPNGWSMEPIPLTEEWLLNFGFVSDNYEFQETYFMDISTDERYNYQTLIQAIYMDEYTNIFIKDVERGNEFDFSDSFITKVKYVHQLQNLYFAITNTKLTLKTEK